ncbi:MAG: V-type ATP synthase subunit I [Actinobacteria bacterium]|nr:V-type ATP synthase subunit I [Actinomycetota bacterium]
MMAIASMLRIEVIGHRSLIAETVTLLQDIGVVDIARLDVELEGVDRPALDTSHCQELDERIARAQFVEGFLGRYHVADVPFKAFISEKIHLTEDEYEALRLDEGFPELYRECEEIAARLARIDRERARLEDLIAELAPWKAVDVEISQLRESGRVAFLAGTVPLVHGPRIRQELREAAADVAVDEAGRAGDREAWVVMAYQDRIDEARSVLATNGFEEASFLYLKGRPAAEIARAREGLRNIALEQVELTQRARELESEYGRAVGRVQALLSMRDALTIRDNFVATEQAFALEGWVPGRMREAVEERLGQLDPSFEVVFKAPEQTDAVPVALENPAWLRPFEVLTDLYGRPRYGDIDPTPLLAGFFFLFFGLCIGDAGYGAVLMIACYLMKSRLDVAPGVKRFMDLMIAGGLASIIIGVLTRSYFALPAESLPTLLRYEPLIDPLRDIVWMLVASVAIGVVHVLFGVLVNVYRLIKSGDWPTAVQDDISSLLLLAAIAIAALTQQAMWLAWIGAVAVALKGRVVESLIARKFKQALLGVGKGLVGLYGITGYLSDFLSYTRLVALGLASLLVGQVMNTLAEMVSGAPWGIGLVAAALILVIGHTFNIVINILGAFVHSARLQFVEFFGKFYEAGTSNYTPFSRRSKSLVLHPAAVRKEGGKPS